MPFFPEDDAVDFAATADVATTQVSKGDMDFATSYRKGLDRSVLSTTTALVGGSVLDLIDTAASSVIPGVDRQQINNTFLGAVGSPGLTAWFDENRGAVEVGSGVAGIIVSDYVAGRILAPAGKAMQAARRIPYVRTIATLDKQYETAKRMANFSALESARRGAVGVDRFIGNQLNFSGLGRAAVDLSPAATSRAVFRTTAAKGLARNATTEAVMAATLHTNDFLYADEFSHNVAWGLAGLGLGVGVDSLVASYSLRKIANSDKVRQLNRMAYDPTGLETQRLHAFDVTDKVLREAGAEPNDLGWMFQGGGGVTDRVTSLAVQASELNSKPGTWTDRTRALFGKRSEIATPQLRMAQEEMNKVTTRGIRGVSGSGFGTKLEGLGGPINQSLYREPTSMYGIEEIGTTVENMTSEQMVELRAGKLDKRWNQVQDLLANGGKWKRTRYNTKEGERFSDELIPLKEGEREALQAEALELNHARQYTPVTMLEAGEWAPISHAKIAEGYEPRRVIMEGGLGDDNLAVWSVERKSKVEPQIGISSHGDLFLPNGLKDPSRLNSTEMLHLYSTGRSMVNHHVKTGITFAVPNKPNWFILDAAEQIIKASDNPALVKFPGGMTREEALVESFAQKVDNLKRMQAAMRMANKRGLNEVISDERLFELKVKLNLPRLSSYQTGLMGAGDHPIDVLLQGIKSGNEVRQMTYQDLLKSMNDGRVIMGLTEGAQPTLKELQGNSFNFLMDENGIPMKPIVGFKRPMRPSEFTRDTLFTRQAMKEAHVRDSLVGPDSDEYTRLLVDSIIADPAAAEARKVMELADDQHRSFVPGFRNSAPQTGPGSFINAITTRERRDVDSMVMRAASQVQELKTRIAQSMTKAIFERNMGNAVTELTSSRNSRSLMLMNQFLSFRQGWEIERAVSTVKLANGESGHMFTLDPDSLSNQKRFKEAFGRELTKGQALVNPNGDTIVLDGMGLDILRRMQAVHDETLAAKNTLLRAQGLSELKSVPWYAPPPSTKGKYVGFTFDINNQVVPGMAIVADSPQQLTELSAKLAHSKQWKDGYTFKQRESIADFMTLWDKAQMEFIAPNTTAIQPGKTNYGISGSNTMNSQAFQEAMVTMRDSLIKHGDDLLETVFDPVIKSARARAEIARVESAVGSRSATQHSSIYDRYLQNLTGRTSLSAKDSWVGDAYAWGEKRINDFLASPAVAKPGKAFGAFNDYLRSMTPGKKTTLHGEKFNQFSKELGPYMPYKSVQEMIERETGDKTPAEVAAITSKLSWFEAASRLRWFESMHAVVNIASILSNTPAVIRSLQPMVGESFADAAARNSSLTMKMSLPNGQGDIALPNTMKLLWQSAKDAWQKTPDEFTRKAIRLGFMDQEVAEFQRAWGAIDSKAGWRGFMFGDETAEGTGFGAKVKRSGGIDKWLGVLSDKSEGFTRQWGMYAGRRVAESMGIHDVDAQLNFAHEMTNKLIANYDPRNRAEIFQGALGAPLGLFQSYTINMYQRLFRYIETGNTRALATQYATQAGIFGTESVPGWEQLNWAFFDRGQGETNADGDPIESMYARLGTDAADLFMHGTLSNLPKLFGGDGMALYTRGDAQFRLPVNPLNVVKGDAVISIPMTDTFKRIYDGVAQAAGALKANDGRIGLNQIAEIVSNTLTNRPLAGLFEVGLAHGYDTDAGGQVVSQSTLPSMASAYRILGTRSMAQQKEIENFYASRNAQEEQGARKDVLNNATRSAIRDERYDAIPALFAKYVEEGGDPRYYSRWIKRSFDAALDTRGERMLDKALNDPNNQSNAYISRLLDGEVDVQEGEENTEDYGRQSQIDALIEKGWETEPNAEVDTGMLESPVPEPEI